LSATKIVRFYCPSRTRSILDEKIAQLPRMPSCDWPTVCLHSDLWYRIHAVDICSYKPKNADQLTLKQMHDQQITYLSSNQRRTHTVRFLCCFAVNIASNIEACAYLSCAIFWRHCRDVRSDVCHGSTISSADFLRKLNYAHKSWPTLAIVWLLLYMYLTLCAIYRVVQKNAQSSMHHNFATVHQKVMRFSAECSERNYLDENGPYLNTAIKYFFLFYSRQANYLRTKVTEIA